jgi:flavin-dependent dehydrogenase
MLPTFPAECDVAIIGGGPAGATTASLLRKMSPSRRVVVLEKARFPRHHIGESTLPEMNRILHKMGALEKIDSAGFVRKRGITYKWASDKPPFSDVFSTGVLDALVGTSGHVPDYSWQVERSRYDAILLSHARELGAEVFEDTQAAGLIRDGDRVRGLEVVRDGERSSLRAEFVVDCSGQARVISSWLHLDKQAHALGDLGIYRYYRGFRWSSELVGSLTASRIFFQAARRGWMWFIPLSEQLVSVGLVTRREFLKQTPPVALFDEELATLPEIVGMLDGAVMASAPADPDPTPRTHTIADWSYSHAAPAGPGYYLAGDAAAFVDPILSSGVLLAHQSGLSVANAINTHWTASDVSEAELHAAYADFYRDLYGGFLRMAHWWYTRRAVGIDEWLKLARELGSNAVGAQEIGDNDSASFMTFAAGFLSDFRFVNVGCGFGDKGLGVSMDGVDGTSVGHKLNLELRERSIRLRSKIRRMDTSAYLATDIGTDRWWRLPIIHLHGEWGEDMYRPPVLGRPHSDEWVTTCLRAIERVLRCCDGSMSLERAVTRTVASFPRDDQQQLRKLCDLVLAGLYVKGRIERA